MSTVAMNPETKDPMVVAIEGMEARLKASMKENRNQEIYRNGESSEAEHEGDY